MTMDHASDQPVYDIFVSYAHVNDEPPPFVARGWVSTFVDTMKRYLVEELGRCDYLRLWMDYELRGNQSVTPEIHGALAYLKPWTPGTWAAALNPRAGRGIRPVLSVYSVADGYGRPAGPEQDVADGANAPSDPRASSRNAYWERRTRVQPGLSTSRTAAVIREIAPHWGAALPGRTRLELGLDLTAVPRCMGTRANPAAPAGRKIGVCPGQSPTQVRPLCDPALSPAPTSSRRSLQSSGHITAPSRSPTPRAPEQRSARLVRRGQGPARTGRDTARLVRAGFG